MPIDREAWLRQLDLSNFVNSYYQYRDISRLIGVKKILVVGPGQGLDTAVFRWRGYDVLTLDVDRTFSPNVVGSVHDLTAFGDAEFDAVIASHVLEHLPPKYLDTALREIARVSRYALVYLPVNGRVARVRFQPAVLGIDWSMTLNLRNPFVRPDPDVANFCNGQHYWEVGTKGFKNRELRARFERDFDLLDCYHNPDWLPSMNYVLGSRRHSA